MRQIAALVLLGAAGFFAVLSACALGVLLFRQCQIWYWDRRTWNAYLKQSPDAHVQAVKDELFRRR